MAQTAAFIYLKHQRDDNFENPLLETSDLNRPDSQPAEASRGSRRCVKAGCSIVEGKFCLFGNKVKETEDFPESFVLFSVKIFGLSSRI